MIEVEIKVQVTDEQKKKLLEGATFISEKKFVDEYYDAFNFSLTINGYWLRKRDNQFEIKLPATADGSFNIKKNIPMQEITTESEIMQALKLQPAVSLDYALTQAGYSCLYRFSNLRKAYKKDGFIIDFDTADFGDLVYQTCEIETMVDSREQVTQAYERLYAFAATYGISPERVEGKIGYYIK
jgi:thiamine-triphosphatase